MGAAILDDWKSYCAWPEIDEMAAQMVNAQKH